MKYYKFLTADNTGEYSKYDYTPHLPKDGQPGEWLPEVERVELCETGYHACEAKDLQHWPNAQLFEVEFEGEVVTGYNKVVGRKMRLVRKIDAWNDKTARLFACWCAEHVLPIYERDYPGDDRPRKAIETARRYANGEATQEELDAAWYADRAADRAAAWAAARDAAWAAAWASARDAAWYAARAAAVRDAAWDAQAAKLIEMLGLEVDK